MISLIPVPAYAAGGFGYDSGLDTTSVGDWEAKLNNANTQAMQIIAEYFGIASASPQSVFWSLVDHVISASDGNNNSSVGEMALGRLYILCSSLNSYFNDRPASDWIQRVWGSVQSLGARTLASLLGLGEVHFEVQEHPSSGFKRIKETTSGLWVVNSRGQYPCCIVNNDGMTSAGDQWIGETTASDRASSGKVALQTLDRLNMMCVQLKEEGIPVQIKAIGSKYKGIWYNRQFYADPNGNPYVCKVDDNQWASSQDRQDTQVKDKDGNPATDDDGNIIQDITNDNSTNIDLSGMTITLPDGKILVADQIIYDESTKTYNIDSHDVTNNYITYNYSWTYHINYTSITYIGQTEEYNKYYEVYYELPDGRDSADLTKEEVEQLNVSIDVIPYGRSADDTSLRSLYHFDGDTKDSSYWNYCTDFTWNKGASLTYMDAGTFEGSLYLDETEHDFTLTLPSGITSGDFTLQFRYYQSYTAAPQTDSYIKLGDTVVFQFNGSEFLDGSGNSLASIPIGSWNEIALIRESGTLYYYLNGVKIGSVSNSTAFDKRITFHFGSSQQTYKYFDELRFLNYALQTGGSNYECTSVPYDTNLSLVLPDSAVPVADEYWVFISEKENLLSEAGYDTWAGDGLPDFEVSEEEFSYNSNGYWSGPSTASKFPGFCYFSSITSVYSYDNYMSIISHDYYDGSHQLPIYYARKSSSSYYCPTYGIHSCLGYKNSVADVTLLDPGDYTFSMVDMDGNVGSFTFTMPSTVPKASYSVLGSMTFNGFYISVYVLQYGSGGYRLWLSIQPTQRDTECSFVYLQLVKGDSTDLSAEFVTSVTAMDKDDLNTPTLAVRTDLGITSYQIGGVRPSLPKKGQVWCLVENQRITSIQIYNGSAWESCDGRIWTGERWIPASSYNIITLQDMYDIVDSTQNYEYIYTESGFWSWWQKSWNAFTEKLFSLLGSGSGGSGGSGADGGDGSTVLRDVDLDTEDEAPNPDDEDGKSLWQFILLVIVGGKSVISGVRHLFSGTVSNVPGSMDSISSAFDSGGSAVGALDGTSSDPDAADLPATASLEDSESEVSDPWRYR